MAAKDKKSTRRIVEIPHYNQGGVSGGLFGGIPHYDGGGVVPGVVTAGTMQGAPNSAQTQHDQQMVGDPTKSIPALFNPADSIHNTFAYAGDIGKDIANSFTVQNQYQAQLAPTTLSNYQPAMQSGLGNALAGYDNFNANQGQQQQLAQALQGVANGQGPNPAQSMLHQATGANVANQAALMAGNRGAGANAGLIGRQAAMAGSSAQQQAAGQAATMQAQQSLGALGQQGQLLGQMGQQNLGEQGINAGLFNTAGQLQNEQNTGQIQNYQMSQGLNQKTAQANADATNKTLGGLTNGIGAVASMFGLAKGGMVPDHLKHIHSIYHADGGEIAAEDFKGVQGKIGNWATDGMSHNQLAAQKLLGSNPPNPGEELPPDVKKPIAVGDYRSGGPVPGTAKVAGDSLKNDTQPAMLSPKEIVLPRSITMAPDAPEKAKEFVEALLKKQGHGNSSHHREFHKALKEAILSRKKKSGG